MKFGTLPTTTVSTEKAIVLTDHQIKMEGQILLFNKTRNPHDVEVHICQEQKTIRLLSANYIKALIHELSNFLEDMVCEEEDEL